MRMSIKAQTHKSTSWHIFTSTVQLKTKADTLQEFFRKAENWQKAIGKGKKKTCTMHWKNKICCQKSTVTSGSYGICCNIRDLRCALYMQNMSLYPIYAYRQPVPSSVHTFWLHVQLDVSEVSKYCNSCDISCFICVFVLYVALADTHRWLNLIETKISLYN